MGYMKIRISRERIRRRVISFVLTILMLFGMMSGLSVNSYATADIITSTLDLTGTPAVTSGPGWSWDSVTKIIILDGVDIQVPSTSSGSIYGLKLPAGSTITLATGSTNNINITGTESNANSYGIYFDTTSLEAKNTINGSGTLITNGGNATGSSVGIGTGNDSWSGYIEIMGGIINATSGKAAFSYAINSHGNILIKDCQVTAVGGDGAENNFSVGIKNDNYDVTITNSTVEAIGGNSNKCSAGIMANRDIIITNSNVRALGGTVSNDAAEYFYYGSFGLIATNHDIIINSGEVTAIGGSAKQRSFGIYSAAFTNFNGGVTNTSSDNITATSSSAIFANSQILFGSPIKTYISSPAGVAMSSGNKYIVTGTGGSIPSTNITISPVNNNLSSITISGIAKVGQTLTAAVAPSGATVKYQWKSAGNDVGTDSTSYTILPGDLNNTITVTATGNESYSGTVTSSATGAVASSAWGGTFPAATTGYAFSGGDGNTAQTPYLISTPADLAQLSANVNAGTTYGGIFFKVTNNLVMNDGTFSNTGEFTKTGDSSTSYAMEWKPIGRTVDQVNYPFKGIFDGDNHTISGIYINKTTSAAVGNNQGLFGYILNSTIKNIGLTDGYIAGYKYVGAIVGMASATKNENILIQNCYNTGIVKAFSEFGGIVGYLGASGGTGIIEKCYNTGSIFGDLAAGIVGKTQETGITSGSAIVRYCYNAGEITSSNSYLGGIIGFNIVTEGIARVEYCYNTGNMNTTIKNDSHAGGIMNENWCYGQGYATLANSYSAGSASYGDGIIGALATKWWNNYTGSTCRQPIINTTYYNSAMSPRTTTSDNGIANSDMTGNRLQGNSSFTDDTIWVFAEGLYPRLAGMENTDAALVSAVPVFLGTGDSAASVTKNITLGQAQGVTWTSSNTNIINITNNSVGTISRPSIDTTVRLTASKNGISRVVELTVQSPALITGIIKTTADTGTSYEGDSLELIIGTITKTSITSIEITGGVVTSADWVYMNANKVPFRNLVDFKVADTVTSVADITGTTSIFPSAKLETIYIAKVINIGANMFISFPVLKSASFPDAISIGASLFSHNIVDGSKTQLTTVNLPKVTSIKDYTFYGCTSLGSISLPEALTIGVSAFDSCSSLLTANMPKVATIGNSAFARCTSLTSVISPNMTTLGIYAFYQCTNLASISLPKLAIVNTSAFQDNTSLTSASFMVATTISGLAFSSCTSLQQATFPILKNSDGTAFQSCTSLSSIRLGITPPAIWGYDTFSSAPVTRAVTFVDASNNELAGADLLRAKTNYNSVLDNKPLDFLWYGWDAGKTAPVTAKVKTTQNPDGITVGAISLFQIMYNVSTTTSLTSIEVLSGVVDWTNMNSSTYKSQIFAALEEFIIADTVTSVAAIPTGMFMDNTTLKTVNMAKLTTIGLYPFGRCSKLTSAIFPDVTTVGYRGFLDSKALTSVSMPLVTTLGEEALKGCSGLLSIELPALTTMGIAAFEGCSQLVAVTLPAITIIPATAFMNCTSLSSISLPEVLTVADGPHYQGGSFTGCNSLATLNLPKATKIGNYTFYGNTALTTVVAPEVTTIGLNAFNRCTNLISAEFNKVTSIGVIAFGGCSSLATADFAQFASTIPTYAFQNCTSLASISIPKATAIDDYAFDGCASLVDIEFPLVTIIGTNPSTFSFAFKNCTGLQTVNFPVALTIQPYAFQGCTSLTTATFPKLTNIKDGAFKSCTSFASLKLPATPPYVALNWSTSVLGIILEEGAVNRQLTFVDASGADLTGTALTSAQVTYKAVNASDGHTILRDTTDNLWFNWRIALGDISTVTVTAITISGTTKVGQTLTASIAPSGSTASYQWKSGGTNVGTNSQTYVIQSADLGKKITVAASGNGGYAGNVTSSETAVITGATINSVSISGTTQVGKTLTAIIAPSGATVSYQWKIAGSNVGTGATYVVKTADIGKKITVVSTGTGNYAGTATSSETAAVVSITTTGVLDAKFTKDQLFDVQRSPAFPVKDINFRISGMRPAYMQNFPTTISWATGDYVKFEYISSVSAAGATMQNAITSSLRWYYTSAAGINNAALVRGIQYSSNGTQKAVISDYGLIWAIDNNEGFLYTALGGAFSNSGGLGTFVSFKPYVYGSSTSYIPDTSDPLSYANIQAKSSVAVADGDNAVTGQDPKFDISGKLVKDDGVTPIPRADIIVTYPQGGTNTYTDITDDDGRFKIEIPIEPLDPINPFAIPVIDDYIITIEEPGKDPISTVIITSGGGITGFGADDITISGGGAEVNNYTDDPGMSIVIYPNTPNGPGGIRVISPEVVSEYTVSFNSNGGNAATAITKAFGEAITLLTVTKTGYTFVGWYRDNQFSTSYTLSTMGAENITLYAKWQANTYKVDGSVKDTGNVVVDGASIKLMAGSRLVVQTTTDNNGLFSVNAVPSGKYNLVISKGVSQTVTVSIAVTNSNIAAGVVTLPTGYKNSVLKVKSNTPDIIVENLNKFFDSNIFTTTDSGIVSAGGIVEIKLTVEMKNESGVNGAANAASIVSEAGIRRTVGIFLNLTLDKITTEIGSTPVSIQLTELADLLNIDIPLTEDQQGKANYVVYRYHSDSVQTITQTANAAGEYIALSADGTVLTLYVKNFSTYAIGYDTPATPSSGSTTTISYAVTATAGVGGTINPTSTRIKKGSSKTFSISALDGYSISDVLVDGKSVGTVSSYTFSNLRLAHTIKAIFVKKGATDGSSTGNTDIDINGATNSFTDVGSKRWFYEAVEYIAEKGLMVGVKKNDGTVVFDPLNETSRGMIVTILYRLEGQPAVIGRSDFSDVREGSWYDNSIAWAAKNNIVNGYLNGTYAPTNKISRQELASILYRYTEYKGYNLTANDDLRSFTDATAVSKWALQSVEWAAGTKLISGVTATQLDSRGFATRAQVATVIQNLLKQLGLI